MKEPYVTMRIYYKTRRKLRMLAALLDTSIVKAIEIAVAEKLKQVTQDPKTDDAPKTQT